MDNLIDNIKKNWLKWESLPFVFAIVLMFYIGIASEVNDWTGIVMGAKEYLLLGIPFLVLFLVYFVCCIVHMAKEKKKAVVECTEAEMKKHKTGKTIWLVTGVCLAALAVALLILVLISGTSSDKRDGKYVIWADEYHIALTPEVYKNYYLSGMAVGVKGDKLSDYSKQCVFEIDFKDDDTFTITYNDKFLGVTPGKNGVGYSSTCTAINWELEEVEEGLYYIRNVDDDTYLQWLEPMQNWTTHSEIDDEYRAQYLVRMEKVELVLISGNSSDKRDGKYVIWADEYHIALTPEVYKTYYLSGMAVGVKGDKLSDYSKQCVFEIDFKDDDTFTITYNDKFLGVTPGKNGVGYSSTCTAINWELEEVEEGLYYIRNVDDDTYLQWLEPMQNWTTHSEIDEEYRNQYLLRMEKVD